MFWSKLRTLWRIEEKVEIATARQEVLLSEILNELIKIRKEFEKMNKR